MHVGGVEGILLGTCYISDRSLGLADYLPVDSLGLVLQMIIVSMCSIAILLRSVAKYRPLPQKEDMKDE